MKRFMALALTLALLSMAGGALAEGFSFRNGITWSSTPEEVQAAESGNEIEMVESTAGNGMPSVMIVVDDVTAAGTEADLHYTFVGGGLLVCGYEFDQEDITLEALQKAMAEKYGDAAPMDNDYLDSLVAVFGGTSLGLEDSVCWKLEDGTFIVLGSYSDDVEIAYFNEPGILALGEAAAAEEEEVINTDGL